MTEKLALRVTKIEAETHHIRSLVLRRDDSSGPLPAFEPGAHIDLFLPNGVTRQYSLVNDPEENDHYVLGVLRERESRGGSAWLCDKLEEGMVLQTGLPRNNFPLVQAERYLFIAGGIGVTPFLSMGSLLHRTGATFELFYCTRSLTETAFLRRIASAGWENRIRLVHDGGNPTKGLDVEALLADPVANTHVYCCGPPGLMNAVRAASAHWPTGTVHFEWFTANPDVHADAPKAFTVILARRQVEFNVPAEKSIVDVLSENGIPVETLCTEGVCGTCITDVLAGEPAHHDSILTDEERRSNQLMTICCSRAKGDRLVLDL